MPVIENFKYHPSFFFRNGHINTIFPYLFRDALDNQYNRKRLDTPDEDFIDIDTLQAGNERCVILCHGLEGSSSSKYMLYTSRFLFANGWDVICMNYRGCSGETNLKAQMYHSGFTHDLHMIIEKYKSQYQQLSLVGFSLGGNMVMKYLGDGNYPLSEKISSAVGISVPCDLHAGALQISRWQNKVYDYRFIVSLKQKVRLKHEKFPDVVSLDKLKETKTLFDFDDHFTAPIHGFRDAADYYAQSNCKQFLPDIRKPSLIINALDDPFLPEESYPFSEAASSDNLFLMAPKYGGHVGFVQRNSEWCWEEEQILTFINDPG